MPVVPISSASRLSAPKAAKRAPPSEPFALMAAAQMHSEGRLIPPDPNAAPPPYLPVANERTS